MVDGKGQSSKRKGIDGVNIFGSKEAKSAETTNKKFRKNSFKAPKMGSFNWLPRTKCERK